MHKKIMNIFLAVGVAAIVVMLCTLMKFEADSVQYDCLKKHCREAMVLYQHIRTRPVFTINDDVTEANYNDFPKLMHSNKNRKIIAPIVQSQYGDTYWWYYYFINKQVK